MGLILSEDAFSFWFTIVFLTVNLPVLFMVRNFWWSNLLMKLTFLTFYSLILGKTILNSSKIEVKPGIKNKGTDKKKTVGCFCLLFSLSNVYCCCQIWWKPIIMQFWHLDYWEVIWLVLESEVFSFLLGKGEVLRWGVSNGARHNWKCFLAKIFFLTF